MKCKYGKHNGYEDIIMGIVDLDNLDLVDLNFSTATPDTIYFYNLVKKLTERGEAKMRGLGLYCNEYNKDSFIYILPDEPLNEQQKAYRNEKHFVDAFNRDIEPYIEDADRVITKELLEVNGWELRNCFGKYYIKYLDNNYNLSLQQDVSNMNNRDWTLHIDNNDFESIANIDIHTVDHFNKAMVLMDIDYAL